MNGRVQEFFWLPSETVRWLRAVAPELNLWVAYWEVGKDAKNIDPSLLSENLFQGRVEDSVHIFLGSLELNSGPVWRSTAGKRLCDMQQSCAVQLVPCIMSNHVLLQGRLALLRADQYVDPQCIGTPQVLFRRLRESMKIFSDPRYVITQRLSDGRKKYWRDMLVGKDVPGQGALRLKQFAQGLVEFDVEVV